MSVPASLDAGLDRSVISLPRAGLDLFLISFLLLFLELACIRWFPAHVLFLTFFTNTILLACFLGMSVGCLAASHTLDCLIWTPHLLMVAMAAGHVIELWRPLLGNFVKVGNQVSPELVFFGTEPLWQDPAQFFIPIEVVEVFFFLTIALAFLGPGQVLGQAFKKLPNRVQAYTFNILGSITGIVLFAACSWWELGPFWWFLVVVLGLAYFLFFFPRANPRPDIHWDRIVWLGGVLLLASLKSGSFRHQERRTIEHIWSPYYRIDYEYAQNHYITVNLIAHQRMVPREGGRDSPAFAYALPYLLCRDSGGRPFEEVLIIGAGSGNDVSRALGWGVRHVDAVEIDPVILRLGLEDHPDRPYRDPRVTVHLDDGRNFLHSTDRKYDLIVYALLDSLVLHSSYSNLRLESYLLTREAFEDVRRHLNPGGVFFMYNYFRQGWIVARLHQELKQTFGHEPLLLTLPYRSIVEPETKGGFTVFIAGEADRLLKAFERQPAYWLPADQAPKPNSPNGFEQDPGPQEGDQWVRFGLASVVYPRGLRIASDEWPFPYLRRPMIPRLSLHGMLIMGCSALLLIFLFMPKPSGGPNRWSFDGRMFFLGAGFMLIETKAVVQMALLFGSTWMVNTVVFLAVLLMILLANLFVLRVEPQPLAGYYMGLLAVLGLNLIIPLDFFLGMGRSVQVVGACLLVFAPIFFAGVIFAASFATSAEPDQDFAANIAGAILGGLAEYGSMLLGFRYLVVLAMIFYVLSAVTHRRMKQAGANALI